MGLVQYTWLSMFSTVGWYKKNNESYDSVFFYTVHVCMNVYKNHINVFSCTSQVWKQTNKKCKNIFISRI